MISISKSDSDRGPSTEVLVLGSLSKSPAYFSFDDEDDKTANHAPMMVAHDALGLPAFREAARAVPAAESILRGLFPMKIAAAQQVATMVQPAMPYIMPGLVSVASAQQVGAVTAKVANRATEISDDFPPIWYLNMPKTNMTNDRQSELQHRVQAIHDFKCWSSLKWWADVFKNVPTTGDHNNKMIQSSAFAFRAAQEMGRLEWLRSNKLNAIQSQTFECMQHELHENIMKLALSQFQEIDEIARRAIEPIFKQVLNSTSDNTVDFNDQRVVMAEKHELDNRTNQIVSSLRLISFQIGESFYSIPEGKDGVRRMVRCSVEFMQFDAEFDMAIWSRFEKGIAAEQKKACQDFIFKRTVDMDRPRTTVAGWELDGIPANLKSQSVVPPNDSDDSDCSD